MRQIQITTQFFCLAILPGIALSQDKSDRSVERSIEKVAYVTEVAGVRIETRYRDRQGRSIAAPAKWSKLRGTRKSNVPEQTRLSFKENRIEGRGIPGRRVRCVLIEVKPNATRYGVYSLAREKTELEMPYPSDPASVVWSGTTAKAAVMRTLVSSGLSQKRATQLLKQQAPAWLANGTRAILVYRTANHEDSPLKVAIYERVTH